MPLWEKSAPRAETPACWIRPGGNIYGEGNVRFGVIKEAMNLMGLQAGHFRMPMYPMAPENLAA